jgi:hypothetical protein
LIELSILLLAAWPFAFWQPLFSLERAQTEPAPNLQAARCAS